jgi:hypothetical protein
LSRPDVQGNRRIVSDAIERQRMIALVIASSTLAGTIFGWYGHKVSLRIEAWGENMNEQEGITQGSSKQFDSDNCGRNRKRVREDASYVPPIGSKHLPVGAAISK